MVKVSDFMQHNYMTMRWLFQDHVGEDGGTEGVIGRKQVMGGTQ